MWDKNLVELLIIKYQEHENLYNVRHPIYMDRVKRSNSLFEICRELKEINKDMSVEEVKKKIHSLRSQYIRELRQVNNSKRSGVGADDVFEPKLWCFTQLQFLKPHCNIRKSVSNISDFSEVNEESGSTLEQDDSSELNNEPEPEAQPIPKKRNITSKLDEGMRSVKSLLSRRLQERTSYDWFGQEVLFEINSLRSDRIRRETVWKIQTILRDASIEDLAERSAATSPQPTTSTNQSEPGCSYQFFKPISATSGNWNISPIAINSQNTTASYTPSPDILQQSLDDILEEEDF